MKGSHKRFHLLKELISLDFIKEIARKNNPKNFTKNRKLTLTDILWISLSRKGLATSMEIYHYYKKKGELSMKVSKQDYFK